MKTKRAPPGIAVAVAMAARNAANTAMKIPNKHVHQKRL